MITVINMCCDEVKKETIAIDYDEEIMSAGWNPAVNLVCAQLQKVSDVERIPMAVKLAALDSLDNDARIEPEIYLRNMRCSQR